MQKLKSIVAGLLMASATVGVAISSARATVSNVSYTGTIQSILNPDGTTGGSFTIPGGPLIGETFFGTFTFDSNDANFQNNPIPGVSFYTSTFGSVFPTLSFSGIGNVSMQPDTQSSFGNDVDTTSPFAASFLSGAITEAAIGPFGPIVDLAVLSGDEVNFGSDTGFEISLFTIDLTASGLSNTDVPNPLVLFDDSFFLFQQSDNGVPIAAAFGVISTITIEAVPEPGALALFGVGLLGLGAMRRRRKSV